MLRTLFTLILATTLASAGTMPRLEGLIANRGQWPVHVLYASRGQNCNVWITNTGVLVDSWKVDRDAKMVNGTVVFTPLDQISGTPLPYPGMRLSDLQICIGRTQKQWYSAPVVNRLTLSYNKGMILVDYIALPNGAVSQTTKDFLSAKPNAVSKSIVYGAYLGDDDGDVPCDVEYMKRGSVVVCGSTKTMEFPKIVGSYQKTLSGNTDGFIARLDSTLQRVEAYTLLGGNQHDAVTSIVSDDENKIYAVGVTASPDFPISTGVTGQVFAGETDGFVCILDEDLKQVQMSTYIGGNYEDAATGIAVGTDGSLYVCGKTTSTAQLPVTFPATVNVLDWNNQVIGTLPGGGASYGKGDGFVARISPMGRIINSRYFGGEDDDEFTALTLDPSNNVYLVGSTTSLDFETEPTREEWYHPGRFPYDTTFNGGNTDAFAVKLEPQLNLSSSGEGSYSTYFGGDGDDVATGIVVDNLGKAYIIGTTNSTNLPAEGSMRPFRVGGTDVFLAVLTTDGRQLNGCTYFGGSADENVKGATPLPGTKNILVYGTTNSPDMPTMGSGSTNERDGATDGFMSVLSLSTNTYTTLITGDNDDDVVAASTDKLGDVYFLLQTTSTNLRPASPLHETPNPNGVMYVGKHVFGTLTLLSPIGGETLCKDKSTVISWTGSGLLPTEKFNIEISTNSGTTWMTIAEHITGTSYTWKPADMSTGTLNHAIARVRTDRGHTSASLSFNLSDPFVLKEYTTFASGCEGAGARLRVRATGSNIAYAWFKDGTLIPDATDSVYIIPILSSENIGQYSVRISATCQSSPTTIKMTVSIAEATAITEQPTSQNIKVGETITLRVVATGQSLTYQWKHNGSPIAGATTAQLQITNATESDEGIYACEILGTCGSAFTSDAVVMVDPVSGVREEATTANGLTISVLPSVVTLQTSNLLTCLLVSDSELIGPVDVSVYNVSGTVVFQTTLTGDTQLSIPISVDGFGSGMYNIVARTSKATVAHSFIVLQ